MPVRCCLQLWLMLLMLFLGGCGSKEEGEEPLLFGVAEDLLGKDIKLADYIAARPASRLGALSYIELEFKRPMVPPHLVGADLA